MKEQILKAKRKFNKRLFGLGMVDVKTLEFFALVKGAPSPGTSLSPPSQLYLAHLQRIQVITTGTRPLCKIQG